MTASMERGGARVTQRQWLVMLALVAVFWRMLTPAGYMLGPADAGGWRIQLCTAQGTVEAFLDPATGALSPVEHGDGSGDPIDRDDPSKICAFAAAAHFAPPADVLGNEPAIYAAPAPSRSFTVQRISTTGMAAPPPWPTGPPAILL